MLELNGYDLESKPKTYRVFSVILILECVLFTDVLRITLVNGVGKSP